MNLAPILPPRPSRRRSLAGPAGSIGLASLRRCGALLALFLLAAPALPAQDNESGSGGNASPGAANGNGSHHHNGNGNNGTTGLENSSLDAFPDLAKQASQGPIDISSTGETTYGNTPTGRVATGTDNVSIQTNDASIYCDHVEYNLDTHEALLVGNVRIYRSDTSIIAEQAVYNFDTKRIRALVFQGTRLPYAFGGIGLFSPGAGAQYNIRNGSFTTDDSSQPDYHLKSKRIRIYPDNRIIYIGSTLYIGTTPVFYFPYFYQSLDQQSGYQITPGYSSTYGAYLLSGITFPITEHLTGVARADYRTERGAALGLNLEYKPLRRVKTPPAYDNGIPYASDDNPSVAAVVPATPTSPHNANGVEGGTNTNGDNTNASGDSSDNSSNGNGANGDNHQQGYAPTGEALSRQIRNREGATLLTYFLHDDKPDLNRTALDRLPVDPDRYRLELKATQFFTDDIFLKADIEKLSDRYLLQDFYEGDFTKNPNPDNVLFATAYQPTFVTSLIARAQLNDFFNTTERLPELTLDVPRMPLANTGLFYTTTNSAGYLERTYDTESPLPGYQAFRIDSYQELTYAKTFFGWLSIVPRVGFRGTWYSKSAPANTFSSDLQQVEDDTDLRTLFALNPATASASDLKRLNELQREIGDFQPQGDIFRPVVDAGVEASFKVSKVYDDTETRYFGLDDMQHVIQPYMNFSEVEDFGVGSRKILQFDRALPTTQLLPLSFPQYDSIDSIDESTVVRVGVRNRLQTKRDALSFDWLEVDTFFQYNIYDPQYSSSVSNLFNQITFRPLPWISATFDSQVPAFNKKSFTELDSSIDVQATSSLDVTVSHLYLNNNPYFANSSLLRLNVYYRIDDNWAAAFSERYEFALHQLQAQSYTIYRDLTSFVASLAFTVRNNDGIEDVGISLNFTLKGVPKVTLPVGFDVNSVENQLTQ